MVQHLYQATIIIQKVMLAASILKLHYHHLSHLLQVVLNILLVLWTFLRMMLIFLYIDCSCTADITLSSSCLASQAQDEAMGDYEEVCTLDDDTKVYIHIDPVINLYIFYSSTYLVR